MISDESGSKSLFVSNKNFHVCVSIGFSNNTGDLYDDSNYEASDSDDSYSSIPPLMREILVRSVQDIDLNTPHEDGLTEVIDDLGTAPGYQLYPNPLPGSHDIVLNAVSGQPYRVQRMWTRHSPSGYNTWYRDVFRSNITYISGNICY